MLDAMLVMRLLSCLWIAPGTADLLVSCSLLSLKHCPAALQVCEGAGNHWQGGQDNREPKCWSEVSHNLDHL